MKTRTKKGAKSPLDTTPLSAFELDLYRDLVGHKAQAMVEHAAKTLIYHGVTVPPRSLSFVPDKGFQLKLSFAFNAGMPMRLMYEALRDTKDAGTDKSRHLLSGELASFGTNIPKMLREVANRMEAEGRKNRTAGPAPNGLDLQSAGPSLVLLPGR